MKLKIDKLLRERQTKKGWSYQFMIDGDLVNAFAYKKQSLSDGDLVDLHPATDSNFFFPTGEMSIQDEIGSLL